MVCRPLGKIVFFSFITHWGTGVDSTHKGVSLTAWGNFFLCNPRGSCSCALDPRGSPPLYFGKKCNL